MDVSVSFSRTWEEYKHGFGDPDGSFWLGNEIIHKLTTRRNYTLQVDLEDWSGETKHAVYTEFRVGSESGSYKLTVSGMISVLIWPL